MEWYPSLFLKFFRQLIFPCRHMCSLESVLAAQQVEEQAYQSSHSRDFEGLMSGTRAVYKRIVRTVGEVRHCRWVRGGRGVLSLQCVFMFCQSPMVEPTFEDDDPNNW